MKPSWHNATAPSLADIETLAAAAWERLPAEFRAKATDILIRVQDFATDEVLDSLGIESPFDLLGLFQGVSLNHQSVMDLPRQPNMVAVHGGSPSPGYAALAGELVIRYLTPLYHPPGDDHLLPTLQRIFLGVHRRGPPMLGVVLDSVWYGRLLSDDVQSPFTL